jgi:hypothetical protein
MSNISEYVKANWGNLPKSTFNDDEVVIVRCDHDSNEGWGNHSYAGVGVDKDGKTMWCYSSGCSCSGSCGVEHKDEFKVLEADFDISELNPMEVMFDSLQVSFADYE